jgi:hypothetical protein
MDTLLIAALTGAFSFAGSWAAIKVRLDYMQRDIDRAHARLDKLHFAKD